MPDSDVSEQRNSPHASADRSPDGDDRIREFLARHGGAGAPLRETGGAGATNGHWEIGAADGHTLRCIWSRSGSRQEMEFSEIPPGADAGGLT